MGKVDQDICNRVCKLYNYGVKTEDIAKEMKLSPSTVRLIRQAKFYDLEYQRLLGVQRERKQDKKDTLKIAFQRLIEAMEDLSDLMKTI